MFGSEKVDFQNKSSNMPTFSSAKKSKYQPVLKQKTAEQRKQEELHGRTLSKFEAGQKGDLKNMHEGIKSPLKN